jgi:hypothetical protein
MSTLASFAYPVNDQSLAVILVLLVLGAGLAAAVRAVVSAFVLLVRPAFALVRTLLLVLALLLLVSAGLLSRGDNPTPGPTSGPSQRPPTLTPAPTSRSGSVPAKPLCRTTPPRRPGACRPRRSGPPRPGAATARPAAQTY